MTDLSAQEEAILVERAKTDPEAFGQLYDRHYRAIFAFLLKRTGHAEVAKDLTSETFFQALRNIHRYRQTGKPFKSWLFAIAVAQVGNYYRGRSKYLAVTMEECPEIAAHESARADYAVLESEAEAEMAATIQLLQRAMEELTEVQQNVLALRYFSGHSIAEIAEILDLKENTVKSHIHRALKRMKAFLEKESLASYGVESAPTNRVPLGAGRVA